MHFQALTAFALASFAVAVSPGPSWVFVISTALRSGTPTGLVAVAGNAAGIICHAGIAALGLSTLLIGSQWPLHVLQWLGAGYLIYLGARICLRQPQTPAADVAESRVQKRGPFVDGLLVNLLNPKVPALMLAMLPQVVDPATPHAGLQMFLVGVLHALIASSVLTGLAVSAGQVRATNQQYRSRQLPARLCGAALILAGVVMLFATV
jgi:homoserine/homoserine lactone efflux protein